VIVWRPEASAQPEAKEVKVCQEGGLSTPCHKVIITVPNDEVKKVSTVLSSMKIRCKGLQRILTEWMGPWPLTLDYLPKMGKSAKL
jgi:hypothetical protein